MTYLDTNILIYLLEKHEPYSSRVAEALEQLALANDTFVTSTISITEFLAGTVASTMHVLHTVPRLQFVPLTEELAEKAALLQRKTQLKLGDAIHVATALAWQADTFFSNDRQLNKIVTNYLTVKQL
jgi:predicted nucleic acid-binding protein